MISETQKPVAKLVWDPIVDCKLSDVEGSEKHRFDRPRNKRIGHAYEVNIGTHTIRLQTILPLHESGRGRLSENDKKTITEKALWYNNKVYFHTILPNFKPKVTKLTEYTIGVIAPEEMARTEATLAKFTDEPQSGQ